MKITERAAADDAALDAAKNAAQTQGQNQGTQEQEQKKPLLPPPPRIFCDAVENALAEIAAAKNVPVELPLATFLALGSACVGRAKAVRYTPEWVEPALNSFIVAVAESGGGKSHVQKYIFQHLDATEAKQKRRYKEDREQYQVDFVNWKKNKDEGKKAPERPRNIQFIVDDSTIEAVAERLEDNPRGMSWFQDEMGGFFSGLDRYNQGGGGNGKKRLLQSFNSGRWSYSRRTKDGQSEEKYLPSATISIFGGIQPDIVPYLFTPEDINQGLVQRFLFIRTVIDKPMRFPAPSISGKTNDLLRKITERLIDIPMFRDVEGPIPEEDILDLSPAARNVLELFMNSYSRNSFGSSAYSFVVKMFNYAIRLAGLIHLIDAAAEDRLFCKEIDSDTMERTVELCAWLLLHSKKIQEYLPRGVKGDQPALVSDSQEINRAAVISIFNEENPEIASQEHTLSELAEKGLGLEFWRGETDRATATCFAVWAKKYGLISKEKKEKDAANGKYKTVKKWVLANFVPPIDAKTDPFLTGFRDGENGGGLDE